MTKRMRGQRGLGSIIRNGSGWEWQRSKTVDGKRHRISSTYGTKAEAEAARQGARPLRPGSVITVEAWLNRWVERLREPMMGQLREARFVEIEQHCRIWLVPNLGKHRLSDLSPSDCDDLWSAMLAAGRRPKTIHNVRSTLAQSLKLAQRDDLIGRNVATLSKAPAEHSAAHVSDAVAQLVLTTEQLETLSNWCLSNLTSHRWAMATLLAVDTGARRGEILGLRWDDLNLTTGTVTFRRQLAHVPIEPGTKEPLLRVPKTRESRRTIKLSPRTIEALRLFKKGQPSTPAGLVFHRDGAVENPNSWTVWTKRWLSPTLAIPHLHPHCLRHTHASHLLSNGVHESEVSRRLGHSSITTTMKIYAHALPEDDSKTADVWEKITSAEARGPDTPE